VPDYHGGMTPNPISVVSRWKIFDNLRRSIVEPCLAALLLAGWFFLPGPAWYWTMATVLLLVLPVYAQAVISVLRTPDFRRIRSTLRSAAGDFAKSHLNVLLAITFLPHQALVMIDAIIRTIVRHHITHCRLLEWETAAEAESGAAARRLIDSYLEWTPWIALGLALVLAFVHPDVCPYAAPFLLLWACAPSVARWLSRGKCTPRTGVTASQQVLLRVSALRIWRYFAENGGAAENWLIPDNVQESACEPVHRISPTNLGLLLNARQAAYDFGYLTLPEFVASTERTLSVTGQLAKHHGHLYNWYDTLTLQPLDPPVISTVDSGNLAASLWALKQGCLSLLIQPIFPKSLWQGLFDHILVLREIDRRKTAPLEALARELGADGWKWLSRLEGVEREARELLAGSEEPFQSWVAALLKRITAVRELADALAPWLGILSHHVVCSATGTENSIEELTLDRLPILCDRVRRNLKSPDSDKLSDAMLRAAVTAENLQTTLRRLATEAERIVDGMDFQLLYDRRKKLLSVGYDVAAGRLDSARYGLLASESRMAAFIAIAKGDIPQDSWFHLGRAQTCWQGHRVLLSWTGTMFEYLMPTLRMKIHPRTILDQSARAAVAMQQTYGRRMRLPWGISESAYAATDGDGWYQYRAFGLPMAALKRANAMPRVIAPYATYLALATHPSRAIRNLRRIDKREWGGRYGLYEAVDFAGNRDGVAVRCWMAHHLAMSLMAIANCLLESPFQQRFHSEPQVMATELLLHEKVPRGLRIESEPYGESPAHVRPDLPDCSHVPAQSLPSQFS
jgi:hypothetical protein